MWSRCATAAIVAFAAAASGWKPPATPPPQRLLRARGPPAPAPQPRAQAKVAYRVPDQNSAEWVEAHSGLSRERVIYLGREIDDMVCNQIISVMLFADAENSADPLYLYINSPGGSVIAGLAVYDTMQHIGSPVITANTGMAASMASFILGAGERGKRVALPNSRVMVHQPMGGSEGQAEDVRVEAEQILKIKGTLVTMYSEMTGQSREKIVKDLGHDNYMSAQQALDYGLIDKIVAVTGHPHPE